MLPGAADQTADITLSGQTFSMRILWNERFQYWSFSLSERGGVPLITNVKMVPSFGLIRRFHKVDLPGDIFFLHRSEKLTRPTFEDLGTNYLLYYFDPESPDEFPVPLLPMV